LGFAEATLAGHDHGMAVFFLIAAGLVALAVYRSGQARGSWTQWRASVGTMRTKRGDTLKSSGAVVLLVVGAVLALVVVFNLAWHH
jgi:hypothetical protein